MSLMNKLLGSEARTTDDYVELDLDEVAAPAYDTEMLVHFAILTERHDLTSSHD